MSVWLKIARLSGALNALNFFKAEKRPPKPLKLPTILEAASPPAP
jgi:hypothetical protein